VIGLSALHIGDPASLWAELGFHLDGDVAWVDEIACWLGARENGLCSWTLQGAEGLHELPLGDQPPVARDRAPVHQNGVVAIDHVVVATPDLARTVAAFEAAGVELRRIRDAGTDDRPVRQAFFRLGRTVAEVVAQGHRAGSGPASFYGIAFTVRDIEETAAFLGPRLRPAKAAVQSGRHIATLDRSAGSTVPMAFMSPEPGRT